MHSKSIRFDLVKNAPNLKLASDAFHVGPGIDLQKNAARICSPPKHIQINNHEHHYD